MARAAAAAVEVMKNSRLFVRIETLPLLTSVLSAEDSLAPGNANARTFTLA
jgi:hypothetical protein